MHGTSPQPDWLEDLVHATGLKREQAFAAMMGAWHVPIYSFLRSMLNEHDDAADATQETFLQVSRSCKWLRLAGHKHVQSIKVIIEEIKSYYQ